MRIAYLCLLLLCVPCAQAQSIQTPDAFLGYPLGSTFTRHDRVVDYVRHVEASSPNVRVQNYGWTNEGRELLVAIVASPRNMARLDDVRRGNLALAQLEGKAGAVDAAGPGGASNSAGNGAMGEASSPENAPAIVWLSYNVHGNESVSTEAAMKTLYDLADEGNERTQAWLQNTIVILDPCINPDGRDRYVNWFNQMVGMEPNFDPDAVEHREPWPGGRTNHYFFDLNRDWSWATQTETRARLALYNEWMPHVHVDFHEQGINNPYYFAPAAEPFHAVITDWQRAFQTEIGRNHARYFDANGWLYFTRQVFDLFYPGYGDTFPTYNGAIGMTYEQGGSGSAGLGVLTATGDTLTLGDRIAHHYTTGLSTVEATSMNRDRVVEEFAAYFERAVSEGSGSYRSYVMKASSGQARLDALARHLDQVGVEYGTVERSRQADGFSYRSQERAGFTAEPGDLVIPGRQPRAVLARVLFEPESNIPDSLTYDITAWALPYAYDLDGWASTTELEVAPWGAGAAGAGSAGGAAGAAGAVGAGGVGSAGGARSGAEASSGGARSGAEASSDGGSPSGSSNRWASTLPDAPYAYVATWEAPSDAQFLASILRAGVLVRYAEKPFSVHGQFFGAGSLIMTRADNNRHGDRFDALVREAAGKHGKPLTGTTTGFVDEGADFGSSDVRYLERPNVAMLFGSPMSSGSVGQIWHWFDQVTGYPVTRIPAESFSGLDLDEYDVLVLPSGSYGGILNDAGLDRLRAWTRSGGRIVAVGGAASFLAGKDGFSLKEKKPEEKADSTLVQEAKKRVYVERERASQPGSNPGAIFRVRTDNTHPLAFGFGKESFVLRLSSGGPQLLTGSSDWNVGVVESDALVSGHVGYKAQEKIEETLAFGVQGMGRGAVVYLIDDPLFRGFWHAGGLLMANAVFLVGQ